MENNLPELVTQISDNINITGLQNLSQCLTEIKPDIEAGGTKFTIIPNIVKDITNFILNKRKINTFFHAISPLTISVFSNKQSLLS